MIYLNLNKLSFFKNHFKFQKNANFKKVKWFLKLKGTASVSSKYVSATNYLHVAEHRSYCFKLLKLLPPVSPDQLKSLLVMSTCADLFCEFDQVFYGFVIMNGRTTDNIFSKKQMIKGFFISFYVVFWTSELGPNS